MIEYYKWQGHTSEHDRWMGFYTIKKSRWVVGGFAGPDGEFQYLGWFFMSGEPHFGDRMIHSSAPEDLEDVDLHLTNENWRGMIKDIFEIDWEVSV